VKVRAVSRLRQALVTLLPLLWACGSGEPPRELRLELPGTLTSREPAVVHVRAIAQDGTARATKGDLAFQVAPPELASVSPRGVLVCTRSGEGHVSLTYLGVTGRTKLSCKLAAKLEAPDKLELDLSSGPRDPQVKVLDAAGQELDLPFTITSDRGSVVQAQSGKLVPGRVGNAKLTVRAGQLSKSIDVEVARTLAPEVLPVDQNRRISYSLDAGKYRLSIVLPAPQPVKVDWLGAPYCQYRGDKAEHVVDCTLQSKGSVSFDNPAFLLRGEKTPSIEGITLREVP
jgi:hypothetical protein